MSHPKKILFQIPTMNPGGIEIHLLRFLNYVKGQFIGTILVRNSIRGDLFAEYNALGLAIKFMPLGYFKPHNWVKYYFYFRKHKFDCICDFSGNFAGIPLWLAKMAGIKKRVVFYRQGEDHFDRSFFKGLYNKWVNRLVYGNATHILSNSRYGLECFFPGRSLSDERFRIISNGVDARIFDQPVDKTALRKQLNIPERAFVIGHCGRLNKFKNQGTLLRVAKKLIEKDQDIYFLLCGKNTELLQRQVDDWDLKANVRLLGYRKDVDKLLKIMNLFYFPSTTEGQPNALMEAMICGIPFIASNITPIKEMVPRELFAWLIPPMEIDGVVDLAMGLKNHYPEAVRMISGCRDRLIEKFSAEKNFNEFAKLLTGL